MKWKDSFQEFIYSLSTNDKYSEYDSRKSFNRVNKPETELLYSANNESSASLHDDSAAGGSPSTSKSAEGIHEVRLAWRHIHQWLKKYTPELSSTLESPCTDADLNDFQKDLNIKLPECVAEFFKLTDGQSSYNENGSGGVLFGLKLLPLEEIMILTEHWRKVAKTLDEEDIQRSRASKANELAKLNSIHGDDDGEVAGGGKKSSPTHARTFNDSEFGSNYTSRNNSSHSLTSPLTAVSSMAAYPSASSSLKKSNDSKIPNSVIPKQKCIPPGRIQPVFAHPLWIPIFTDEVGNCMGIDLYPPNPDHWGQVILFGREFDTKYLIADNFGDFLLIFANDLETGNWEIKKTYDETNFGNLMIGNDGEFVFIDRQDTKLEVNYFEVLKKRSIDKWIASLESEADGLSLENKTLIENLKNESKNVITLKNGKSIDEFINSNLALIDKVNTPLNEVKETKGLPSKTDSQRKPSPLKIVTEVEESKLPQPVKDTPSGESTSNESVKESPGKDLTEVQI